MATIINTPPSGDSSDSGAGIVLGVIVALVLITLFLVYVLPTFRSAPSQSQSTPNGINVNVTLPSTTSSTPASGSTTY